jgi:hypothetical protein
MKKIRYPQYDVLQEQEAWDSHTRDIVLARLEGGCKFHSLTLTEAEMLRAICSVLAGDNRADLIQFVLSHIDQSMDAQTGESERKDNVPKAGELVRTGLAGLDQWAITQKGQPFINMSETDQHSAVLALSQESLPMPTKHRFAQKALFNRLLSWTVESYYSHPTVWSEIGYGGPAYPRGYVRTSIGQTDPWEAKQ